MTRVLLVEDDAEWVSAARRHLGEGLEIRDAGSLAAAAQLIDWPDVCILDLTLPDSPLPSVTYARMRASRPDLPILVWSAAPDEVSESGDGLLAILDKAETATDRGLRPTVLELADRAPVPGPREVRDRLRAVEEGLDELRDQVQAGFDDLRQRMGGGGGGGDGLALVLARLEAMDGRRPSRTARATQALETMARPMTRASSVLVETLSRSVDTILGWGPRAIGGLLLAGGMGVGVALGTLELTDAGQAIGRAAREVMGLTTPAAAEARPSTDGSSGATTTDGWPDDAPTDHHGPPEPTP